jgi:MSHA biogenesis protein MshJ
MKNPVTKLLIVVNKLTPKQRILLGIGVILIIYILWLNFSWNRLKAAKKDIATEISMVENEINSLKDTLRHKKEGLDYKEKMAAYASGTEPIAFNIPDFHYAEKYVMSADEIRTALTSVLDAKKKSSLLLLELHNLPEKKISDAGDLNIFVYQNDFVIKFSGEYFSTIEYLKYLEQLPWPLFLDTMEYKVIKYPTAEITLHMHLISKQGGLLRV